MEVWDVETTSYKITYMTVLDEAGGSVE